MSNALIRLLGESLLGIRVHDNARGIWYSPYPEGEACIVQAGAGNLTINIGITNVGTKPNRIWLRLNDSQFPFDTLIDYIAYGTPAGGFHNFEVTTDMPNKTYILELNWWVADNGNVIDEGSRILTIYFVNPNPPPVDGDGPTYPTQQECENAGYFWYDNACHLNPKPTDEEEETWFDKHKTEVAVGGVTAFAAIVLAVLVGKK